MLETFKYVRKPFYIDAVQLSAENLTDVAGWCQGEVRSEGDGTKYVKVRVHRPLNERQTKAFIGDWVLYAGTGFKVYTNKAFLNSFEQDSVGGTYVETSADAPVAVEVVEEVVVTAPVKKVAKRPATVVEPSPLPVPTV